MVLPKPFSHFIGQSFPLSQLAATINLGTGFVKFVYSTRFDLVCESTGGGGGGGGGG